jgi:hypothetical protein
MVESWSWTRVFKKETKKKIKNITSRGGAIGSSSGS